jgi:hypothetical protein
VNPWKVALIAIFAVLLLVGQIGANRGPLGDRVYRFCVLQFLFQIAISTII